MFGRALRHSARELLAVALALLLLLLAYSHAGHLVRPPFFFCSFPPSVAELLKFLKECQYQSKGRAHLLIQCFFFFFRFDPLNGGKIKANDK